MQDQRTLMKFWRPGVRLGDMEMSGNIIVCFMELG